MCKQKKTLKYKIPIQSRKKIKTKKVQKSKQTRLKQSML